MARIGNRYQAGSYKLAAHLTKDNNHNIYIVKDNVLLGWIDVNDEVRPEAKQVIDYFKSQDIKTILLSGDRLEPCQRLADQLGIEKVIAEKSPAEKLEIIAGLTASSPTAMVGDGINDAPALAKATIGISMSDASQIAMQTAQVVLMNQGLKNCQRPSASASILISLLNKTSSGHLPIILLLSPWQHWVSLHPSLGHW